MVVCLFVYLCPYVCERRDSRADGGRRLEKRAQTIIKTIP